MVPVPLRSSLDIPDQMTRTWTLIRRRKLSLSTTPSIPKHYPCALTLSHLCLFTEYASCACYLKHMRCGPTSIKLSDFKTMNTLVVHFWKQPGTTVSPPRVFFPFPSFSFLVYPFSFLFLFFSLVITRQPLGRSMTQNKGKGQ